MIYLGNFSYNDELDSTDNYCLMPCIVEADSTDHALELSRSTLLRLQRHLTCLTAQKRFSWILLLSWEKFLPLL